MIYLIFIDCNVWFSEPGRRPEDPRTCPGLPADQFGEVFGPAEL